MLVLIKIWGRLHLRILLPLLDKLLIGPISQNCLLLIKHFIDMRVLLLVIHIRKKLRSFLLLIPQYFPLLDQRPQLALLHFHIP